MSSRTRSRKQASIGSNHSLRRPTPISASEPRTGNFVLLLVMAWSPPAHNAGNVRVSAPGDYATFNSNHTPDGTYYLLLRLSSSVFGQSVLAARALSAVLGILTLCAAATLPGSSLSRTARLALPLLIAASPGAAWYDREARSYALLLLLSTVITLASIRFLRAKVQEDCQARHAILMLMVAALLASFTHYFGFLTPAERFLPCFRLP